MTQKLEEAKRLYKTANADQKYVLEKLFPELKESEDERIRKALIHLVNSNKELSFGIDSYDGIKWSDILAWLEKQGEQKLADKVEPKFKKGDVIRRKDGDGLEWTVEDVYKDGYYTIVCADRDDFIQLDDKWELVEQKHTPKYKVGDTIYYDSFGRLVSFTIANIIEDGTDNPMYEDKNGNSVFQNDIIEQKPVDKVEPKFKVGDIV